MPISEGIPAPDFELLDDTGTPRRLIDYRGKAVILYFYPADDTPDVRRKLAIFVMTILITKKQE